VVSCIGSTGKVGPVAGGSATDPAGGAGALVADGGSGRDGVIGQLGDVGLGDRKQGSGIGSAGRSGVDLHDQHSRSTRRIPLLVAYTFWSGRGNMAFLAPL
jgi:hypothetical protein